MNTEINQNRIADGIPQAANLRQSALSELQPVALSLNSGQGDFLGSVLELNRRKQALVELVGSHPAALIYVQTQWHEKSLNELAKERCAEQAASIARLWKRWQGADALNAQDYAQLVKSQIQVLVGLGLDRFHLIELVEFVQKVSANKLTATNDVESKLIQISQVANASTSLKQEAISCALVSLSEFYSECYETHLGVIRATVNKIVAQRPYCDNQLLTSAILGFLYAIDNSRSDNGGVNAFVQIRMRGAALDEARKIQAAYCGYGRKLIGLSANLSQASLLFQEKVGRSPDAQELKSIHNLLSPLNSFSEEEKTDAKQGQIKLVLYQQFLNGGGNFSLDEEVDSGSGDVFDGYEHLADPSIPGADCDAQREQLAGLIRILIGELPEKQRQAVELYYLKDVSLAKIGEQLGLAESRICQLIGYAQQYLNKRIRKILESSQVGGLDSKAGMDEYSDLSQGFKKRSTVVSSHVRISIADQLQRHIKANQIKSIPAQEDDFSGLRSPGLYRAIDARRQEQFNRDLQALLPTSVYLNQDFLRFLPKYLADLCLQLSVAEIGSFVRATNQLLTGRDQHNGYSDGLAARALNLAWPLVETLAAQRGKFDLSIAFEVLVALQSINLALNIEEELPSSALDLLAELSRQVSESSKRSLSSPWQIIAERIVVLNYRAEIAKLNALNSKAVTASLYEVLTKEKIN